MNKVKMVFVFGSNLAGIHGGGAAKHARLHEGAIHKVGEGLAGNSYALPTKGWHINTLPLNAIKGHVDKFLQFAHEHIMLEFMVTQVGCGLAGYKAEDIAPMFKDAPRNCHFDTAWTPYLGDTVNYWGHM